MSLNWTIMEVRFWWLSMTPLGGPVVPLEKGSTARLVLGSMLALLSKPDPSLSVNWVKGVAVLVGRSERVTRGRRGPKPSWAAETRGTRGSTVTTSRGLARASTWVTDCSAVSPGTAHLGHLGGSEERRDGQDGDPHSEGA